MRVGVLCIQLGTPDAPTPEALRPYLKQFLSDARVLDVPAWQRWLLLNFAILPFRPKRSAHAYAQVWQPEGSPLAVNSQAFAKALQARLPAEEYHVVLAMRYGANDMAHAVEKLLSEPLRELVILPMFPQYASATIGSCLEEAYQLLAKRWNIPPVRVIPPFFQEPGFIQTLVDKILPALQEVKPDRIVFSFHGLPERQILKGAYSKQACLQKDDSCCNSLNSGNAYCYRAQCFATARALVSALGESAVPSLTTFQSRLGRTPWIKPYTEEVLKDLPRQGAKRVLIVSPSFTADCLETLEELGIRGRETFLGAGGEVFELISAVNDSPTFVAAAAAWISQKTSF